MASICLALGGGAGGGGRSRGKAVQVEPRVESAWIQRLKLEARLRSFKFCFQFQLAPLNRGGGCSRGAAVQVEILLQPVFKAPGFSALN
jgi:hypothetical protein